MSFIALIQQGVETAFSIGKEFVTVGVYFKKEGNGSYNPATDVTTPGANDIPNVRFLKVAADVSEREASPVGINDVKFLVPFVDLPSVEPGDADQFEPGDGHRYNMLARKFVPGDSIHILFGRRA